MTVGICREEVGGQTVLQCRFKEESAIRCWNEAFRCGDPLVEVEVDPNKNAKVDFATAPPP